MVISLLAHLVVQLTVQAESVGTHTLLITDVMTLKRFVPHILLIVSINF